MAADGTVTLASGNGTSTGVISASGRFLLLGGMTLASIRAVASQTLLVRMPTEATLQSVKGAWSVASLQDAIHDRTDEVQAVSGTLLFDGAGAVRLVQSARSVARLDEHVTGFVTPDVPNAQVSGIPAANFVAQAYEGAHSEPTGSYDVAPQRDTPLRRGTTGTQG